MKKRVDIWQVLFFSMIALAFVAANFPLENAFLKTNLNGAGYAITNVTDFVTTLGRSLSGTYTTATGAQATATTALSLGNGTTALSSATVAIGRPEMSMLQGGDDPLIFAYAMDGLYEKVGAWEWRKRVTATIDGTYWKAWKGDPPGNPVGEDSGTRWRLLLLQAGSEEANYLRASNPNDTATHPGAVAGWDRWDDVGEEWVPHGVVGYATIVRDLIVTTGAAKTPIAGVYRATGNSAIGNPPDYRGEVSGTSIGWNGSNWEISDGANYWTGDGNDPSQTPDTPQSWSPFTPGEEDWAPTVTALTNTGVNLSDIVEALHRDSLRRLTPATATEYRLVYSDGQGGIVQSGFASHTATNLIFRSDNYSLYPSITQTASVTASEGMPHYVFDADGEFACFWIPVQNISALRLYCYTTAHAGNYGGTWRAVFMRFTGTANSTATTNTATLTKTAAGAQHQLVTFSNPTMPSGSGPLSLYLTWTTNTTAAASITNVWIRQATYLP